MEARRIERFRMILVESWRREASPKGDGARFEPPFELEVRAT